MNKRILGLDIGANCVVGFFLDVIPTPPYPNWYRKHGKDRIHKINFTNKSKKKTVESSDGTDLADAIKLLTTLKPDVIILEPTGVWYSSLWVKLAEHLGIEVRWIGHQDLAHNRGNYGFKDKDDRTDAFCLALSYFDPAFSSERWLKGKPIMAAELHSRLLELKGIERSKVAQINQLRQRLKLEFPEIADRAITNAVTNNGFTAWIGWLAGIHQYTRIETEYRQSIVKTLGIEISSYSRDHALSIATLQQREFRIEQEMEYFLESEELAPYAKVLERFGMGTRTAAAVIGSVYPIEKFLVDGKPIIERWEDDQKRYKRNRSRSGFQMSMGMGKRLIESGGASVQRYSGSGLTRKSLYVWVSTQVLSKPTADTWLRKELDKRAEEPRHENQRQARPLLVSSLYWDWKKTKGGNQAKHKAGIKATMTLAYRVTKLLYDELMKEIVNSK